jgi:4-hydroxy-tetrahydrodipicolinate synthase
MTLFRGLAAFPITPADAEGRVDVDALRRLIRRLVDAKVDSIGLLGSTGGYAYLARDERRRAIEAAVAEAAGAVPIMAGVGALRTDHAIQFAQDAKTAGAQAGLLAPLSYTPLTEDEVFAHFQAVAKGSNLPICVYNNPGVTHFNFTPALIGRLSRIPGVVAVKNPAPEAADVPAEMTGLKAEVREGFALGHSGDWRMTEMMIGGGSAWYSVAAGLWPRPLLEIVRAIEAGEPDKARALNARLASLWDLFQRHTGFRVVHAAANLMGLSSHQPPRPILPLGETPRAELAAVMAKLDLD